MTFTDTSTYVDSDLPVASPESVSFNHGLGEIITALQAAGLTFESLTEHQTAPWNQLDTAMVDVGGGEFALRERPERLAATYTLTATKATD